MDTAPPTGGGPTLETLREVLNRLSELAFPGPGAGTNIGDHGVMPGMDERRTEVDDWQATWRIDHHHRIRMMLVRNMSELQPLPGRRTGPGADARQYPPLARELAASMVSPIPR